MHRSPQELHNSPRSRWIVHSGGPYQAPGGRNFPLHSNVHWEWVYLRSGVIEAAHGDQTFEMGPGSLWLTPLGICHAEFAKTDYSNYFLEVAGPAHGTLPILIRDDEDSSMGHLFRMLIRELGSRAAHGERMVDFLTRHWPSISTV